MAIVIHSKTKTVSRSDIQKVNGNSSVVDSSWELVDPNPNIHSLFLQFNEEYFNGRLAGCEVKWSARMTLCAGMCHYEGRGGLCSIRLSQPLLKFRPRKDLVETLLHEMIHAYLFVTDNNKDHDGHGPEFHKHMFRINGIAGTNITVYHNFHAEVAIYKQHWWRCDGCCRDKKPFYGWVKRASNRAPGPYDNWYNDHQRTCGGKFIKVKEPEGYQAKKGAKKNETPGGTGNVLKNKQENVASSSTSSSVKSKIPKKNSGSTSDSSSIKTTKTLDDYFSRLSGNGHVIGSNQLDSVKNNDASSSLVLSIIDRQMVACPVCGSQISEAQINVHLDSCITI